VKYLPTILFFPMLLLVAAATLAEEAEPVTIGFPETGTHLVFEKRVNGETSRLAWTVVDDTQHRGRRVHRLVGPSGFEFYDAESHSWSMSQIGERVTEVHPHNGQLNDPLWVGKAWESRFLYTRRDGSKAEQHRRWRVTARETVEVPAGRFDTLRVESAGEQLDITLWYAPEIHFYVRRETRGMVNVTQELVEYTPAAKGTAAGRGVE